ncbi:MAG: fumarylacetoacetate hydrolase family protein [Actinomycetes bacterium]
MAFRLANIAGRATLIVETPTAEWMPNQGIDVERASGGAIPSDLIGAIERFDQLHALTGRDCDVFFDQTDVGCPVPSPVQVFAIGLNYRSHAEESGMAIPEIPMVFTKFGSSICGPTSTVNLPSASVDWEAELVVVIGRGGRTIAESDALNHVAGFTGGQDLSERVLQFASNPAQFSLAKSFAEFGPIGPVVTSVDAFEDPNNIGMWCELDGERVQTGRTDDLVFGVSELIAYLSTVCDLYPGDLIFTGTPSGVGFTRQPPRFLSPGQLLVTSFDGIGALRNPIR